MRRGIDCDRSGSRSRPVSRRSLSSACPTASRGKVLKQFLESLQAVILFDISRAVTTPRLLVAAILAAVPAFIALGVRFSTDIPADTRVWAALLYALVPEAICLLSLLLWMCPAIQSHLESKTWVYLAIRPHGRRAMLLGAFATAVVWTVAVGVASAAMTILAAQPPDAFRLFTVICGLVILSAVGRGAIFALVSTIMPRRAMVLSVVYTLIFEFLAGFLPAIVNQFTVALRLRSLLVQGMGWKTSMLRELKLFFDPEPAWIQIGAILTITIVSLTAAVIVLELRQFGTPDET